MNYISAYIPYTYRIKCIPTGEYYYGVRYARGCNPCDLWVKYFTSSKTVHALIKKFGKSSFSYEVRKEFSSAKDAVAWETRVNTRLINFPNYLNKNNGHRFSNNSSIKGGQSSSLLVKGTVWWNNGTRNTRSKLSPGNEWTCGYLRGVTHSAPTTRIAGVKLHWWNNGISNKLSATLPGNGWYPGMISKRRWWNNGEVQIMSDEPPDATWLPGFCPATKLLLSRKATARYNSVEEDK